MAMLPLYLPGKIVREIKEIPELFYKAEFKKDTDVFKQIEKIISEQNISVSTILDTPKSDIIKILKLKSDEDKKKFVTMRAVLRKADIIQRDRINIDDTKNLTWDQVCQFFEQNIGSSDVDETVTWYTFFEEYPLKGSVLQKVKLDTLAKNLKLTGGQKVEFKELLKKIQPKKKGNNSKTMNNNGVTAAMVMDSGRVTARDIRLHQSSNAAATKSSSSDDTASEESNQDDSSD